MFQMKKPFMLWTGSAVVSLLLTACQSVPTTRPSSEAATTPRSAAVPAASHRLLFGEDMTVTVLPVGAGSCHVIQCPGSDDVIVDDCGATRVGDRGWTKDRVMARVHELVPDGSQVSIVMTHGDADHTNYLPDIFPDDGRVRISAVYYGGRDATYKDSVRAWVNAFRTAHIPVHGWGSVAAGEHLTCGRAEAKILAVNATHGQSSNGDSLVLGLAYGGHTAILPGDATGATEQAAIRYTFGVIHADLLEASHHGAVTHDSNSQTWADDTKPNVLFVSAQWQSQYGHPRCEAVNRYLLSLDGGEASHDFSCRDQGGNWHTTATSRAVYNTANSGDELRMDFHPASAFEPLSLPTRSH